MSPLEQIEHAMAKAFFCSAYADQADESENGPNMLGRDWMDVLPEAIDPAALHAARTLVMGMEQANKGATLDAIYATAQLLSDDSGWIAHGDRGLTPDNFGHYCAMQAMGHGVGLHDAFGQAIYEAIKVPYVEFGSHSLQKDYFGNPQET